jgi:hypothetical protein
MMSHEHPSVRIKQAPKHSCAVMSCNRSSKRWRIPMQHLVTPCSADHPGQASLTPSKLKLLIPLPLLILPPLSVSQAAPLSIASYSLFHLLHSVHCSMLNKAGGHHQQRNKVTLRGWNIKRNLVLSSRHYGFIMELPR